jgi:hypothetical protein
MEELKPTAFTEIGSVKETPPMFNAQKYKILISYKYQKNT